MTITTVHAAGRTHVGMVRKRNEDSHYIGTNLVAVADGMGGHVSGEIASSTAIAALRACDRATSAETVGDTLSKAFAAVNRTIQQKIKADGALKGMGTTLVAVMWSGSTAALANVGDSRAYRLRGGLLERLTDDHVYSRLLAHADAVPTLPDRISRYFDGRADGRSADLIPLELRPADRLLLCSDGLSSYVAADDIQEALAVAATPEEAADNLVGLALAVGGEDNVTVVVLDS